MALREYERRILAEIEHRLCEDDPALAGHLETFGADDPSFGRRARAARWKPWVICGLIGVVVVGLMVLLFMATPPPPSEASQPGTTPEVVAPEAEPAAPD